MKEDILMSIYSECSLENKRFLKFPSFLKVLLNECRRFVVYLYINECRRFVVFFIHKCCLIEISQIIQLKDFNLKEKRIGM